MNLSTSTCGSRRSVSRAPREEADEVDRGVLHAPPHTHLYTLVLEPRTQRFTNARRRQRDQLGLAARVLRAPTGARQEDR